MPTANLEDRSARYLPLSLPIALMCGVVGALMLLLSLSTCFDAIVVFNYATVPTPGDLTTATFRIMHVASRTPNFNVRFGDGTTASLSFPDRLGGNPKGGFKMPQITAGAIEQLTGCMATAKIRSVLSAFGRRNQVWELECPQAHIYYSPEVAASEIRQHPQFDLVFSLMFAAVFLIGAFLLAMAAITLGKKTEAQIR